MGYKPSKRELTAIIRRIDEDGDSKISFTEFANAICPQSRELVYSEMNRPLNKIQREKVDERMSPIRKKRVPNADDMDYILTEDENQSPQQPK